MSISLWPNFACFRRRQLSLISSWRTSRASLLFMSLRILGVKRRWLVNYSCSPFTSTWSSSFVSLAFLVNAGSWRMGLLINCSSISFILRMIGVGSPSSTMSMWSLAKSILFLPFFLNCCFAEDLWCYWEADSPILSLFMILRVRSGFPPRNIGFCYLLTLWIIFWVSAPISFECSIFCFRPSMTGRTLSGLPTGT